MNFITTIPVWLLILNTAMLLGLLSAGYWIGILMLRLQSVEGRLKNLTTDAQARIAELETAAAETKEALKEPAPARVFADMQSTQRAKVLKLHKVGKTAEEIAQLVGMPAATVRLHLKVQAIELKSTPLSMREKKAEINSSIHLRNSFDRGIARQESIA